MLWKAIQCSGKLFNALESSGKLWKAIQCSGKPFLWDPLEFNFPFKN